jgi:hypothetical protein
MVAVLPFLVIACASAGSTYDSGVGDAFLEHPPYYAGARVTSSSARVAHLPIAYQRGATQPYSFDPAEGAGTAVATLIAEMNAYLDSLRVTTPIGRGAVLRGTPPDVQFGCYPDASGDCGDPDSSGPVLRRTPTDDVAMRLAVGRPSDPWISSTRDALDRVDAERAVVITLEVGQYYLTTTGWRDRKSIELGTRHSVRLPWLTSIEAPISVLQLTGALMDADGRAVRIGAEGMLARRTDIVMSGFGAQRLITDEDVSQLRTQRRDDLPGRPLVWQVALRTLLGQLTGVAVAPSGPDGARDPQQDR